MCNSDFASKQLSKILNRVSRAAKASNRDLSEIKIVAASKQQPSTVIRTFHAAGISTVGENYLQEALIKREQLKDIDIDWHYIGKLQSNKCKAVAQNFSWVHTIDRLKLAQRFDQYGKSFNTETFKPLNILIQLNIDQEQSKAGIPIEQAPTLCAQVHELENIRLRGFMLIPKPTKTPELQRKPFEIARKTLENVNQRYGFKLDSLSMGMSNDLESAILEGSTMIRIGTDLFGPRK
ncbi:UNVERIFIED_CONTAM: hypothetical protein GTU68_030269 [Idotea baltica]|nr:hypothetical protein [Idotea baltica]